MPHILAMTANPLGTDQLRVDHEIRKIRSRLSNAPNFTIEHLGAARPEELLRVLERVRPDLLHFACHGETTRGKFHLELEDKHGMSSKVSAATLGRVFASLESPPQCVFLNSCFSDDQANVIARHVKVVVGAAGSLDDELGADFAGSFYEWLGLGRPVGKAFTLAKEQTILAGGNPRQFKIRGRPQGLKQRYFGTPEIMASFKTKNGTPVSVKDADDNRIYSIFLWIRGAENFAESAFYELLDDSYSNDERYWEISRADDRSFMEYEFTSYGQLRIRATLWADRRGIGITSSLTEALYRYYGNAPTPSIQMALKNLAEN